MSFQKYLDSLDRGAQECLDSIPSEMCTPIEPIEHKLLALEKSASVIQKEIDKSLDLSPLARSCMEKISEELTQITLRTRLAPVKDEQYKYLMKCAGVDVPEGRNDYLNNISESTLRKISNGVRLTHEESLFEKAAGLRDWAVRHFTRAGRAAGAGEKALAAEAALPGQLMTQGQSAVKSLESAAYKAIEKNPQAAKQFAMLPEAQRRAFALRYAKSNMPEQMANVRSIGQQTGQARQAVKSTRNAQAEAQIQKDIAPVEMMGGGPLKVKQPGGGVPATPQPPEGGGYKHLATGLGIALPVAGVGAYMAGSSGGSQQQQRPAPMGYYRGYGY